jgi:hypothetical protein
MEDEGSLDREGSGVEETESVFVVEGALVGVEVTEMEEVAELEKEGIGRSLGSVEGDGVIEGLGVLAGVLLSLIWGVIDLDGDSVRVGECDFETVAVAVRVAAAVLEDEGNRELEGRGDASGTTGIGELDIVGVGLFVWVELGLSLGALLLLIVEVGLFWMGSGVSVAVLVDFGVLLSLGDLEGVLDSLLILEGEGSLLGESEGVEEGWVMLADSEAEGVWVVVLEGEIEAVAERLFEEVLVGDNEGDIVGLGVKLWENEGDTEMDFEGEGVREAVRDGVWEGDVLGPMVLDPEGVDVMDPDRFVGALVILADFDIVGEAVKLPEGETVRAAEGVGVEELEATMMLTFVWQVSKLEDRSYTVIVTVTIPPVVKIDWLRVKSNSWQLSVLPLSTSRGEMKAVKLFGGVMTLTTNGLHLATGLVRSTTRTWTSEQTSELRE